MTSRSFDEAYYQRFYVRRPVHTPTQIGALASGVVGLCDWWGIRIRSVLDVGAGPGYWRDWFAEHRPAVKYRSIDVSPYACEHYGHERRDITEWASPRPADLVVCQGVLQYLANAQAEAAILNLARSTRHVLYLEVPTKADSVDVIDVEATDLECHWRTGTWYRTRLQPHFVQVGAGLWAHREGAVPFYELERSH
jgi:SAM-dependent methyltransferase